MTKAIGMMGRGQGIARIADHKTLNSYFGNDLRMAITHPYQITGFGPRLFGYEATVLLDVCEAIQGVGIRRQEMKKSTIAVFMQSEGTA